MRDEFPVKIDKHSSAIGLEFLSDSNWKIIPRVAPAQVRIGVYYQYT